MSAAIDTDYAQHQRDHHKRMLSQLQPVSGSTSPTQNPSTASLPSPFSPSNTDTSRDRGSTSASSSFDSTLPSPPPASAFMDIFGASQQPPFRDPSAYKDTSSIDPLDPNGARGMNDMYSLQPNLAYGQLFDSQPITDPAIQPRQFYAASQSANQTFGMALEMNAQPQQQFCSTYDPLLNPYGLSNATVFGYAQHHVQPPSALDAQSSPASYTVPFGKSAINPDYLQQTPAVLKPRDDLSRGNQMDEDDPSDFPPSPIRSLSGSESPLPMVQEPFHTGIKSRLRRTSEGDHFNNDNKNKKHKRKMTWTPGMAYEGPNVSQAQKERELMELERLEQGGPSTRRERRRLQNRLAQRAFRARSKVQNAEAATHLTDLEQLAEMQADQLRKMNEALEKLQRENAALKAQSSAKANAERAHYNKGAPP